jgi:hypothetical protein
MLLHGTGCAVLVGGAVAGGAAGTAASVEESQKGDHAAKTYAGTVLANVVYLPAKVVFAAAGALTSGLTYVLTLGNEEPSSSIWSASVEGDYVVTPRMIDGDDPVRFVGSSERDDRSARASHDAGDS